MLAREHGDQGQESGVRSRPKPGVSEDQRPSRKGWRWAENRDGRGAVGRSLWLRDGGASVTQSSKERAWGLGSPAGRELRGRFL